MRGKLFGPFNGPLTVELLDDRQPDGYVVFIDWRGREVMRILRKPFEALMEELAAKAKYETK